MVENLKNIIDSYTQGSNPRRPLNIEETANGLTAFYLNASNLLEDSWCLVERDSIPRAVALLVLAIEELAKIPKLYDHYISISAKNLSRKEITQPWQEFWKAFSKHGEKQKTIENYGKILRKMEDESMLHNQHTPYFTFLNEDISKKLDCLKQRCFYVDYIESGFVEPSKICNIDLYDELYTFTLERLYSFGALHGTRSRSKNMLESAQEFINRISSKNLTQEQLEESVNDYRNINRRPASKDPSLVQLDIIYWASHRSSSVVPDYLTFKNIMAYYTKEINNSDLNLTLTRVVKKIIANVKQDKLPNLAFRHYQMLKLIYSFAEEAVKNKIITQNDFDKLFT